jgi:hypothetical protein
MQRQIHSNDVRLIQFLVDHYLESLLVYVDFCTKKPLSS